MANPLGEDIPDYQNDPAYQELAEADPDNQYGLADWFSSPPAQATLGTDAQTSHDVILNQSGGGGNFYIASGQPVLDDNGIPIKGQYSSGNDVNFADQPGYLNKALSTDNVQPVSSSTSALQNFLAIAAAGWAGGTARIQQQAAEQQAQLQYVPPRNNTYLYVGIGLIVVVFLIMERKG